MGRDYSHEFWLNNEKYQSLAEAYESNIVIRHPKRAKGECSRFCGKCIWAATCVEYPSYEGPAIA